MTTLDVAAAFFREVFGKESPTIALKNRPELSSSSG